MSLSEFDRRCRGYHRRTADAWRRTRLLGAILLNINRGENTPSVVPEEWLPLYGDGPPVLAEVMSEEEFARIASLE